MPDVPKQTPFGLLTRWLQAAAPEDGLKWLAEKVDLVADGEVRALYLSFGLAARKLGKADLVLSDEDRAEAQAVREGWDPSGWSVSQAARTLLVLSFPSGVASVYSEVLDRLFQTGEVGELVALYQSLPLLPHPEMHTARAAEGVRSSIRPVLCAVAHRNPYPAEHFQQGAWNQMILKCLFTDVPLHPVVGLEARANTELTSMLCDYAHERWAAKRTVSPELWRVVGYAPTPESVADLARVLSDGSELEQQAAALALANCRTSEAMQALSTRPDLREKVESGGITWKKLQTCLQEGRKSLADFTGPGNPTAPPLEGSKKEIATNRDDCL